MQSVNAIRFCSSTGALLALLAILSYLPALTQPFIADDYLQIDLGRRYGAMQSWPDLFSDVLYRCRATSIVVTHWTEQLFGTRPLPYYATSVGLHVLNTWLVFALGAFPPIGRRVSAAAAAFFAICECHNEAVMWYAALPELLVFFFGLLSVLAWILWLERGLDRKYYALALLAFVLALASKESAVCLVPLLGALLIARGRWKLAFRLAPFAAIAAVYAALIFTSRTAHLHFSDGTFDLAAPLLTTLRNSMGRLLWVWGLLSLLLICWRRAWEWWRLMAFAGAWMVITLLPYSFLNYMPRVPSRHTYLASAGLALVVAAGLLTLRGRAPVAVALTALLVGNVGYLWTRKRLQFLERAAPTEALIEMARTAQRPIHVRCFPYWIGIADLAVEIGAGMPNSVLREPATELRLPNDPEFCWGEPSGREATAAALQ